MLNLDHNKKYILGCSYGPDSMALLDMLEKEHYNFVVAHVDYNIRPESKQEEDALREYTKLHNIPFYCFFCYYPLVDDNLEALCRKVRYNYFSDLYKALNADALLIAHHEDDLLETYILQKKRGSRVEFFGLRRERILRDMNVIRPLLNYSKQDLLKYCHDNDVPYAIDSTNLTNIYQRNKVRHEIVEKMSVEERKEMRKKIDDENAYVEKCMRSLDNVDVTSVKELLELDDELFYVALYRSLREDFDYKGKMIISADCAREIRKALESDNPNIEIPLANHIVLIKAYEKCYFDFKECPDPYYYWTEFPVELKTVEFHMDFNLGAEDRNVHDEDYPITIRPAEPDDEFYIKDYKVTCRRAFIDWKMPRRLRKLWPVIENKDHKIIYVPRYRADYVPKKGENFIVFLK